MLSIIIPVHNVEKYIESLLDSIINGGFDAKNDEVIIVDDGSTDQTVDRIRFFEQNNEAFQYKLLTQNCTGVSNARNAGLKIATKDYVWFVDGDDMLPKGVLSFLHSIILKTHPDLIEGGYLPVNEDAKTFALDYEFREINTKKNSGGSAWTMIVKRNFLLENHILFQEE